MKQPCSGNANQDSCCFRDAMERHWQDAEVLFQEKRWANADHLYGFSAECGLKSVMVANGTMEMRDGKPKDKEHRVHINTLWGDFNSRQQASRSPKLRLDGENPFQDWHVGQRYFKSDFLMEDQVNRHRLGAEKIRERVKKAMEKLTANPVV